ncbi:MAG: hypothetical protein LUF27_11790 [Lachnospiraceae bacterium]|nr:hypothetical protein [Lachnospiraceae bacterium]
MAEAGFIQTDSRGAGTPCCNPAAAEIFPQNLFSMENGAATACPRCGSREKEGNACACCGWDFSRDILSFPSLVLLSAEEMEQFENNLAMDWQAERQDSHCGETDRNGTGCQEGLTAQEQYERGKKCYSEKRFPEAVGHFLQALGSPEGDKDTCFLLEVLYADCIGKMNELDAFSACECMYFLGCCYSSGSGVSRDPGIAKDLFEKAEQELLHIGISDKNDKTGRLYTETLKQTWLLENMHRFDSRDMALKTKAEEYKEDTDGSVWLREGYRQLYRGLTDGSSGDGHNFFEIYMDFMMAAKKGNTDAMVMAGNCLRFGMGPSGTSVAEALKWYRKAAEEGESAEALYQLAVNAWGGRNRDYKEACRCRCQAAKLGHMLAQYETGEKNYNVRKYDRARYWFEKVLLHAEDEIAGTLGRKKHAEFLLHAGICYTKGDEKNIKKAWKLFQKADKLGNREARKYAEKYKKIISFLRPLLCLRA